jgi:hypothetical protein
LVEIVKNSYGYSLSNNRHVVGRSCRIQRERGGGDALVELPKPLLGLVEEWKLFWFTYSYKKGLWLAYIVVFVVGYNLA